jgi:hypothetical protein
VPAENDREQRLFAAKRLRADLGKTGIYFAPIRHHSVACARAAQALIADVRPEAVLIEGDSTLDTLLPALMDPAAKPPLAVLVLRKADGETFSSLYPMADFSPEWVSLRAAVELGAQVAFIDQPWAERKADSQTRSLMNERYYAESQTLARLAVQEHCRDQDELWEHLFELRADTGWEEFFDEVFTWSALARLDYEPQVLEAEGSLARETVMTAHIQAWRNRVTGPIAVVTGAFHTLQLIEALSGHEPPAASPAPAELRRDKGPWLIRYDLTRLDAYSGYGAGIRSPGYYQRVWEASDASPTAACLVDIARAANAAETTDTISVAEVIEATLQAERLADLRGHPWPGRTDLLDACASCFSSGEQLPPAVRDAIAEVFGGAKLGELPPNTPTPPIVAEARAWAQRLRLDVSDSLRRHTVLDVRRSASARERARFLALMAFLNAGFAAKTAGPDYIAGRNLGRVREEWDYAWTPMVEAALIGLVADGATLREVAATRLRRAERELDGSPNRRSSNAVAQLIAQALLIGLGDEAGRLRDKIDAMVERDPELSSVVGASNYLLGLWRSADMLSIDSPQSLIGVVAKSCPQIAYLLEQASQVKEDAEPAAVTALLSAAELARQLADPFPDMADVIYSAIARLRDARKTSPGVLGAALAVAVPGTDPGISERVLAAFAPGGDPDHAVRMLAGLMQAAPDLILHVPEILDAIDAAVARLENEDFLLFLPELRRSFTFLKPFETAKVAERIAQRTGVAAEELAATLAISESDMRLGAAVEQALRASLAADALLEWCDA